MVLGGGWAWLVAFWWQLPAGNSDVIVMGIRLRA